MDSTTKPISRDFAFAGTDDELLEVVHTWSLMLPGNRERPEGTDLEAIDPAAWAIAQLEDGDYLWIGNPKEKRIDAGCLVRIDAPIRRFHPVYSIPSEYEIRQTIIAIANKMPFTIPGDAAWQFVRVGTISILVDSQKIPMQGLVSYPEIAIVDEICGILVDMFADRAQFAPVQGRKSGNPGRTAHKRARERLSAGEDEKTVKDDWRDDYKNETGQAPDDTTSGERELWRNVKRGNNSGK